MPTLCCISLLNLPLPPCHGRPDCLLCLSARPPPQGDHDPVDVVEIGSATCAMGGVYPVKPLGEQQQHGI